MHVMHIQSANQGISRLQRQLQFWYYLTSKSSTPHNRGFCRALVLVFLGFFFPFREREGLKQRNSINTPEKADTPLYSAVEMHLAANSSYVNWTTQPELRNWAPVFNTHSLAILRYYCWIAHFILNMSDVFQLKRQIQWSYALFLHIATQRIKPFSYILPQHIFYNLTLIFVLTNSKYICSSLCTFSSSCYLQFASFLFLLPFTLPFLFLLLCYFHVCYLSVILFSLILYSACNNFSSVTLYLFIRHKGCPSLPKVICGS